MGCCDLLRLWTVMSRGRKEQVFAGGVRRCTDKERYWSDVRVGNR